LAGSLVVADTNLTITGFGDGYLTWTNLNPSLHYSVQWKPSLTDTNEWSESYRGLQDVESTNDLVQIPAPMLFRIVGRSNAVHTMQIDSASNRLATGYYEATNLSAVDPDLVGGNIVKGATVFGIDGSLLPDGGSATAADVTSGRTFYGAGQSNWVVQVGTYGDNQNGPDYYDLNQSPHDGFEFRLDPSGIYVAPSAHGGNDGSGCGLGPLGTGVSNVPCATIGMGIQRASATGRDTIYVANGVYEESVTLPDGMNLMAGGGSEDDGGGDVSGGTGGGGGAGGGAGASGTGGAGGGGSFCVFVDGGAAPLIHDNVFYLGLGGTGGDGGAGGGGGKGRDGGLGGNGTWGGGIGGDGGRGGDGGAGGGGGGGAGGMACGILIDGIPGANPAAYLGGNSFIGGTGGLGGSGGGSVAAPGTKGVNGAVERVDVR